MQKKKKMIAVMRFEPGLDHTFALSESIHNTKEHKYSRTKALRGPW